MKMRLIIAVPLLLLLLLQQPADAFVLPNNNNVNHISRAGTTRLQSWSGSSGYLEHLNAPEEKSAAEAPALHQAGTNTGSTTTTTDHDYYQEHQQYQEQLQRQHDEWAYLAEYNSKTVTALNNPTNHNTNTNNDPRNDPQHSPMNEEAHGTSGDCHATDNAQQEEYSYGRVQPAELLLSPEEQFEQEYLMMQQLREQDLLRQHEQLLESSTTTPALSPEEEADALEQQRLQKLYEEQQIEKFRGEVSVLESSSSPPPQQQQVQTKPKKQSKSSKLLLSPEEVQQQEAFLNMVSSEIQVKKMLGQNTIPITQIPVGTALSRTVDTLEDIAVLARRWPYKNGLSDKPDFEQLEQQGKKRRPTIVVLGTGWAANAFQKVACTYDLKLIIVSPVNHFVFTPMLAAAAVGTVEYRSMTEPIRTSNPTIENYIEGKAVGVDVENKKVTVELTSLSLITPANIDRVGGANKRPNPKQPLKPPTTITLDYDHLICAVGTTVRSSMVPGAKEHCFNLKTSIDSKKLRTGIGEALEYASRPDVQGSDPAMVAERRRRVKFVVIGGGPTGVELAAELNDFLQDICRPIKGAFSRLADDVSVMLVHGGNSLVPQFDAELRPYAMEALQKRGIEVRLNTYTTEVTDYSIKLKAKGENTVEEEIPNGLTVWAAGNEPVPFVKELLSQLPESAAGPGGRIRVDPWLRAPTHSPETFGSILVLGDGGYLEAHPGDPKSAMPQTAQVAGQQGAFAARLLNRYYDLTETPPKLGYKSLNEFSKLRIYLYARGLEQSPHFIFLNLGLLAYVGGGEALTQVMFGEVPIFNVAGKFAYTLWQSVYLGKQASSRNRALIIFDWFKSELFGRDITRL